MITILNITDSLSLPRKKPEQVLFDEAWPQLVKQSIPCKMVNLAMGGNSIADLLGQSDYYTGVEPDVLIVQSGIVDCAPRALTKFEAQLINKSAILRVLFFKMIGSKRLRRYRNISYTSKKEFGKYIDKFCEKFKGVKIYWITIVPASEEYEKALPGITKRVNEYNELLEEKSRQHHFELISTKNIPSSGIMSDHHHLSKEGHAWVAAQVQSRLEEILRNKEAKQKESTF